MDRIIRMLTKIGYLIEDLGKVKKWAQTII
jgi:hypothetical protein